MDILIDECIVECSDFAMATLLHTLYKDHECEGKGSYKSLSLFLSTVVATRVLSRSMHWSSLAEKATGTLQDMLYDKAKKLHAVYAKLRSRKGKDEIIKEFNNVYA